MRVVAGSARGRRLVAPPGPAVRPTSDRVREAVFNALGSLDVVRDAVVVDLFAGSGALGIEALSRGAARATFVDRDRVALAAVRANLDATGLAGRASVVRADATSPTDVARVTAGADLPDLVLIDPPYAFDEWGPLLSGLAAGCPHAVVVAESDRDVDPPAGGLVVRRRRYGGTVVSIMTLTGDASASPTTEDAP